MFLAILEGADPFEQIRSLQKVTFLFSCFLAVYYCREDYSQQKLQKVKRPVIS